MLHCICMSEFSVHMAILQAQSCRHREPLPEVTRCMGRLSGVRSLAVSMQRFSSAVNPDVHPVLGGDSVVLGYAHGSTG